MDGDELTVFTTQAPQVLEPGLRLRVGAVVECVGSGATGHVYRVLDELGTAIAVREYFPAALATRTDGLVFPHPQRDAGFEAGRKRFVEDGEQLAALDHPGLLKVQQVWSECGTSYQAMPWCEGRTLDEVLRSAPVPPSQALLSDWLRAMADALALVHRQVGVHGHLSPSQVMRLDSGRLLVMEFSRARRFLARDPRDIERDPYAALECGSDARYGPMGPWTDIYALAAIAHFAVRGRPPQAPVRRIAYDAQEPLLQDIDGNYDDAFLHGIDCGLALRPRSRPRDLQAFMARAGLHERRSRPRSSGESLLINLHLADPVGWAAEPAAAKAADSPEVAVPPIVAPMHEAAPAAAPTAAAAFDDPAAPIAPADDEPWPSVAVPPQAPAAREARRFKPIHEIPRAPERRRGARAGSVLAWLMGVGAVTALVTVVVMPSDPLGELVLPPTSAGSANAPGAAPQDAAQADPAASAAEAATASLGAASAASSSIPEPMEPTAAGPATPMPAEPGASMPRVDEPAATESNSATPPVAVPQAREGQEPPAPPLPAPQRSPATRANPPAAAPAAAAPVAPRPSDEPAAASAPFSPCPGLLARQYVGRPLDAAEREQLNALCR